MNRIIPLSLCLLFTGILGSLQAQRHLHETSSPPVPRKFVERENRSGSQSLRDLQPTEPEPRERKRSAIPARSNDFTKIEVLAQADDYVLYRDVVRRYTWLEGVGEPITRETAGHLPYYYRLSMKNRAGHYQRVEALHGDSLTTVHPLSPYILDKNNDTDPNNEAWRERLQTVGQWLFYSDLSGENVVEERAYEARSKDAGLVYAMQVVRNDPNHATITYLDSWGLPADMNESDEYTYGSVVSITYDERGCDAVIDFLDGEGYRKMNTNGVDQQRYLYDEKLRPVLITSNNCVGDNVIDNWGNCGTKISYDDRNGIISVVYVDKDLRPMRMPSHRADREETFIRCDIRKDPWGRIAQKTFLTAEGQRDTTASGIHRIRYVYTDDGRLKEKVCLDLQDRVLNFDD